MPRPTIFPEASLIATAVLDPPQSTQRYRGILVEVDDCGESQDDLVKSTSALFMRRDHTG